MSQASAASQSGITGNVGAGAITTGENKNLWWIAGAIVVVLIVAYFILKPGSKPA